MYMNIDWDTLSNIGSPDSELSDSERVSLFNKAANVIKLKAGFVPHSENFVIHRDESYTYVYIKSVASMQTKTFPVSFTERPFLQQIQQEYSDILCKEYKYLVCIPNEVFDFIIFDKVINNMESIKREYNMHNQLDSDHLHKTSEQNYFFFETLLRSGIDTNLYMYNIDLKWSYKIMSYSSDEKQTAIPSLSINQRLYLEHSDFNSIDTEKVLKKIKPYMSANDRELSLEDCVVAGQVAKNTTVYKTISQGLARRQLLLCNNYYDFYNSTRRDIIKCMI